MKKTMYNLSVLMMICFACQPPDLATSSVGPGEIYLACNYLGLCEKFHEGEKPLRIIVVRDDYEGGTQVAWNKEIRVYERTNDRHEEQNYLLEDDDLFDIPMTIPDGGSYSLRVFIEGRDCYNCCDGPSCDEYLGKPAFTDISNFINMNYRPFQIILCPTYPMCY